MLVAGSQIYCNDYFQGLPPPGANPAVAPQPLAPFGLEGLQTASARTGQRHWNIGLQPAPPHQQLGNARVAGHGSQGTAVGSLHINGKPRPALDIQALDRLTSNRQGEWK